MREEKKSWQEVENEINETNSPQKTARQGEPQQQEEL